MQALVNRLNHVLSEIKVTTSDVLLDILLSEKNQLLSQISWLTTAGNIQQG